MSMLYGSRTLHARENQNNQVIILKWVQFTHTFVVINYFDLKADRKRMKIVKKRKISVMGLCRMTE